MNHTKYLPKENRVLFNLNRSYINLLGPKRDISIYISLLRSIRLDRFKIGPSPASFSLIFGLFQTKNIFYNKFMLKNVHPEYGSGIRTHDLKSIG